ncbi:MAG TPA: DUF418 domain-containing protein [Flavisolibacter sp.]|nr:DUF418 domain-containing protein [Flavisolibacter sp.]
MSQSLSAPLRQAERISIIDTLRGLALLGILMMNIPYFSAPEVQSYNLNVLNEYSGPNFYTWMVVNVTFEGTMRAIFSMLFGAGCLLLLDRLAKTPEVDAANIYHRRLLWLFLFGMINAYILLWPGDILYSYAVCGLFLYPFKKMKAGHLLIISFVLMLAMMTKGTYQIWKQKNIREKGEAALVVEKNKAKLTPAQTDAKEAWLRLQERNKPESLLREAEKERAGIRQDYFSVLGYLSGINAMLQSKKFYHWSFLDNMIAIFLGMALFRWGVLTAKRSKKFYWLMMLGGYGLGLPLSYYEHSTLVAIRFDYTRVLDLFFVEFYEPRRLLVAFGHAGLILLLYKYGFFKQLYRGFARVGQMAFSNYLMQTLICGTIFYGYGFALYGKLERYETYYVVGAVWIFQFIFSNIWLRYFRFGPFEWIWRSLTYWKKQPMKKKKPLPEPAPALA